MELSTISPEQKMNNQPLVSIVTPAYNEEIYIAECLDSIIAQTYQHWECIVANNCSADATGDIARRYAARDSRIKVFDNKSVLPAMRNFNQALQRISPAAVYCKLVLADDWLFPECIEKMVGVVEVFPSVGIVGAYGLQDDQVLWQGLPYGSSFFSGREVCRRRLLGGPYVFGSQTSVLFRSDLVRAHDPFFNELSPHGSDSKACFELLKDSDFGFVFQVLTYSRQRAGSLVEEAFKLNTWAADTLTELHEFGAYFLTPEEFAIRSREVINKYYDFLATNMFRGRRKSFWEFHKRRLGAEGVDFGYLSLLGGLARKTVERIRVRQRGQLKWGL